MNNTGIHLPFSNSKGNRVRLYTWWQKTGYSLKAKSRHGVHSPFVYDFIEQVLLRKQHSGAAVYAGLNEKQQYLLGAIVNHYRPGELVCGNKSLVLDKTGAGTLFLLTQNDAFPDQCSENDIALILDIYAGAGQTKAWRKLAESSAIPLSIDVFEMGILFFKREFRVKQHFILKYR
jgi:hypothetical protein